MLDPEQLKAELAAKAVRMKSPLWAETSHSTEQDWSSLMKSGPTSTDAARAESPPMVPPPLASIELRAEEPRLASLEQAVTDLARAMGGRRPAESGAVPAWLQTAAGNPLTYDAPEARRVNVCARLLPSTYASVKRAKIQLGLRTIAGTWEYLLRLGLAAAERMPE